MDDAQCTDTGHSFARSHLSSVIYHTDDLREMHSELHVSSIDTTVLAH